MSKYDGYRPRLDDLEEKTTKKKKKFNIFDLMYNKKSNEDAIADKNVERNFKFFFTLFKRNATNIFYINLITVLSNFPIFLLLLAFSENLHLKAMAPADALFAPIYGAFRLGVSSPNAAAMYGLYGVNSSVALWTPAAKAVLVIGIILLLITFGPSMIGTTYLLRNIVKGEPLFLLRDFRYSVKKNFGQGVILGILDLLISFLLVYDIYFFYLNAATLPGTICFWASICLLVIYFFMRFYIYMLALTFDLKITKIYKNALIFTILGFKRNIVAFLGILLVIFLNYSLAIIWLPIGILLPFIFTVTLCAFMANYAAWPVVKKLMIDPYYPDYDKPSDADISDVNVVENDSAEA